MCIVAQLIEKLQTLPQDAIVEVLREYHSGYSTGTELEAVDLDDIGVMDFTSEKDRELYPHLAGKIFISLNAV